MLTYSQSELDKMANHERWSVRLEAARKGYALETLVHDEDFSVRREVAKQNYGLNILVNDEHPDVRLHVARQGFGLDVLVNDKSWVIREEVAKQFYNLETLVNDEHHLVCKLAKKLIKAKKHYLVERNFGTYEGNLHLYIFEDFYEIHSGCYSTKSISAWYEECSKQLNSEIAEKYSQKIKDLIAQ